MFTCPAYLYSDRPILLCKVYFYYVISGGVWGLAADLALGTSRYRAETRRWFGRGEHLMSLSPNAASELNVFRGDRNSFRMKGT